MPTSRDDPKSRFLDYYGRYLEAKERKQQLLIWLNAVHCTLEPLKMGDHTEEARFCGNIFRGFVTQEQVQQIYRELYDDSRSYPQQQGK